MSGRRERVRLAIGLNALKEGLFDWYVQVNRIAFSPVYLTMLGYDEDAFSHSMDSFFDLLHSNDRMKSKEAPDRFFGCGEDESSSELRM